MSEHTDRIEPSIKETDENEEKVEETPKKSHPRILHKFRRESEPNFRKSIDNQRQKSKIVISTDSETQTEWSWLQDMQLIEKIRREGADLFDEIIHDFEQTDSEESEAETESLISKPSPKPTPVPLVESVGPPKILQFQPETKKFEITAPSPPLSLESEPIEDLGQFMKDFNVYISGGQTCEFCGHITKPWPTIANQENNNPESLHCCNDYQEFVEGLIQYQIEKEKIRNGDLFDNEKSKPRIKNLKARKLAEERTALRNMQRLIEKEKRMERLANQKLEKQQQQLHLQAKKEMHTNSKVSDQRDPIKKARKYLVYSSQSDLEEKPQQSSYSLKLPLTVSATNDLRIISKSSINISSMDTPIISNQVRSINYQLSNLKYIQDGWTVRPTSPLDFDELSVDEIEFNLLARTNAQSLTEKTFDKPLIIRKYKNDSNCLILFPDGSGNVFYPSGRIALSITQVSPGMHTLSAFTDDEVYPSLIASFDPFGNGSANFLNGKIKLLLSPLGGLELDSEGTRKKRWMWWDTEEHVHAPPIQPLIFALNNHISVKIFNQDKINVNFYAENQVCKFRVGSKIKISRPEQMPPSFKIDANEVFLKKRRSRIEELLRMLNDDSNSLLRLPKIVNPRDMNTPRTKLNYDIFKLTQDKRVDNFKSSKANQKASSKFITVP